MTARTTPAEAVAYREKQRRARILLRARATAESTPEMICAQHGYAPASVGFALGTAQHCIRELLALIGQITRDGAGGDAA